MTDQEINEAVAKKLGWKQCSCIGGPYEQEHRAYMPSMNHRVPNYCRDIGAAFEIIEKVSAAHSFNIAYNKILKKFWCDILTDISGDESKITGGDADTAPMAICLAFLKVA